MNITRVTIKFWEERQPKPAWTKLFQPKIPDKPTSIDAVINSQAQVVNPDRHYAAHNLMNLCRHYSKRGVLREELARISVEPGTIMSPRRRAGYALKWLRRIQRQDAQRKKNAT